MTRKREYGFASLLPLLIAGFLIVSVVAVKSEGGDKVLGNKTENTESTKEIKEVKVRETKTKLEEVMNKEALKKKVNISNESGKVKAKIQGKVHEFEAEEGRVKLKVKESDDSLEVELEDHEDDDSSKDTEKDVKVSPVGDDELEIETENHSVRTNLPITVDQEKGTISVTTPQGDVKVKQLPSTAIDNLVENRVFGDVTESEIKESSGSGGNKVVYKFEGTDVVNFLGLLPVRAKVSAEVNAETGKTTSITRPWFLNTFGFLFSK